MADDLTIKPQAGPQERFLATSADIAIYGGSAGGGKTWALLLEPLRHVSNPNFGAVIFRREAVQITNEGGLWDESAKLYPLVGGKPKLAPRPTYSFASRARVSFAHLNHEGDVLDWQGAQIPLIEFDELTHFSKSQFFYMLSRNRSTCGVRPYMRATCNPDADSWVAEFIAWWIDQETGLPIPERSGVIRWFARVSDVIYWADSPQELADTYGCSPEDAKSVTFIAASIRDNQILLRADPGYLANLKALARVERERLLGGNWKIRPAAGLYFMRQDAVLLSERPHDVQRWVRSWDLAATEKTEDSPDPDWTAGALLGRRPSGRVVVADVIHVRRKSADVHKLVKATAEHDGRHTSIRLQQDPGQAGKDQIQSYTMELSGFPVFSRLMTGDKIMRAEPVAAQWQAGNIEVVRGPWNEEFFAELEGFPEAKHDDQVDCLAEGYAAMPYAAVRPDYTKGGLSRLNQAAL